MSRAITGAEGAAKAAPFGSVAESADTGLSARYALGMAVNPITITPEAIRRTLEANRSELTGDLGVELLEVFGSVLHGDTTSASDIDLLAVLRRPAGLLRWAHVEERLSELLGCEVDLIPRDGLKPRIAVRVREEAVNVFQA